MKKITVIGAGSWGCALARILADNGYDVLLYDIDEETVNEINKKHTNTKKLFNASLPENVSATTSLSLAINNSNIIILVVPTAVVRNVLKQINENISEKKLFVNASKGIEPNTFKRVSEIVLEEINPKYYDGFVALTGPSHAEEVVEQQLTFLGAASNNKEQAQLVQNMFSNNQYFRVYTVEDLIGAELGGALKNIYAIICGIVDGLGYGVNAKAAVISRALVEMKRLAKAMGAKEDTLNGLTGVGDLIVTCTSTLSRNYQAGLMIGTGDSLDEALSKMTMVVEGARTCISAYQAAKQLGIYTPLIDGLYDVIYNHKNPKDVLSEFMNNKLKDEND